MKSGCSLKAASLPLIKARSCCRPKEEHGQDGGIGVNRVLEDLRQHPDANHLKSNAEEARDKEDESEPFRRIARRALRVAWNGGGSRDALQGDCRDATKKIYE